MPKVSLSVAHALGQDEAKKRLANLIAQSRAQYVGSVSDVSETWDGYVNTFSFRAMGFAVSGKLDIQPAQVSVDLQIPLAALPFKSRLEKDLLAHVRQLLA